MPSATVREVGAFPEMHSNLSPREAGRLLQLLLRGASRLERNERQHALSEHAFCHSHNT